MEVTTSRSVVLKKFGAYDAISIEQFELPPLDGKVEVKVEFGGLNFADLYTRQGLMSDRKLPFVLGMECAGVVTAIGVEGTELTVGQKVICYDYKCGMYRETIRVSPDKCYPIPDDVNLEEATTIFVNYLTAYFSVFNQGNLKQNESVLILSCAGGVGWAATQLAKTVKGVKIFGTASPGKEAEAKANGVHEVFVLNDAFEATLGCAVPEGFDLIISNQGGQTFRALQNLLRPLGRIVIIGANNLIQNERRLSRFMQIKDALFGGKHVGLEPLIIHNRSVAGLHLGTLIETDPERVREALKHVFEMLKASQIKPKIHSVLPMGKIVDATKILAERKNIGKVLISMKEPEAE